MANVKLNDLQSWLMNTLTGLKMTQENAELVTDTVMRATLRGVGHHDIYDFPGRLNGLLEGKYPPNPDFQPIASFKTMESWDGGNGLGELICSFAMERAMKLADEYGIGLCAMRNSNHYMAAAPYVERASERGYIALLLCKGTPTMGAPGRTEKVVGTLPMGFAVPTDHGYPIMLDACMAYASFGVLKAHMDSCTPVPAYWGFDKEGNPTTDPAAMAQGTRLPIGGHKGFGLAVLGEVLTALLSDGCLIDEKDELHNHPDPTCHTAIAIKADALMDMDRFRARSGDLIDLMCDRAPGLHVPGQGSSKKKDEFLQAGCIDLKESLLEKLDAFSQASGLAPLPRE